MTRGYYFITKEKSRIKIVSKRPYYEVKYGNAACTLQCGVYLLCYVTAKLQLNYLDPHQHWWYLFS